MKSDGLIWLLAGAVGYLIYKQTQSSAQPEVVYLNGFPGYAYGHDQPIINVTVPPPPAPTPMPPAPPPGP
jgi:hypothetical protein